MSNIDKSKLYQPSGKAYYSQSGWIEIYETKPKKQDSCLFRILFYLIAIILLTGSILLLSLDNSINMLH